MGMFQNITKQMEGMEDGGDDSEEEDLTEEEKKEADAMLKNLFGAMGVDPSAAGAGGMPGMPGMGFPGMGMPGTPGMGQPQPQPGNQANQPDFASQMN